ncbi:MAG: hypothetical protein IIW50_00920 [Alistipes sp.]|nr:hypothetical protein [Alistipes sp.]
MQSTQDIVSVAEGISNFGFMAIVSAVYVLLTAAMLFFTFKWFKSIIDGIINTSNKSMVDLLAETKKQNEQLMDISEGLKPETIMRLKNTSNVYFDLAVEKVCRIIKKVKEENHIADRETTKAKIHNLILNLHEDRNSRFDSYTYKGRKLSSYTSLEWVDWVAEVVEREVYEANYNNGRAYSNVCLVYEKIKLDFYHRMC